MQELTPSEVVALFGLDERRVRKDIEYGVFDRIKGPRRFALAEVVYLFAVGGLALELGVDDRKKIYRLIAAALDERKLPESIEPGGYFQVKLATAVHDVENRIERFAKWKKKLVTREDILGGEPVFPKSRLAVRQIGEMARRGAPVKEIVEDYPYLEEQDIEFAKQFVTAILAWGVRVSVKLLLDENLSPAAAVAVRADGIDAYHVRDRGILAATDQELLDRSYQEDRILLTSNVDDFEMLATARELHAGIVLIERAGLLRDEQIAFAKQPSTTDSRADMIRSTFGIGRLTEPLSAERR